MLSHAAPSHNCWRHFLRDPQKVQCSNRLVEVHCLLSGCDNTFLELWSGSAYHHMNQEWLTQRSVSQTVMCYQIPMSSKSVTYYHTLPIKQSLSKTLPVHIHAVCRSPERESCDQSSGAGECGDHTMFCLSPLALLGRQHIVSPPSHHRQWCHLLLIKWQTLNASSPWAVQHPWHTLWC